MIITHKVAIVFYINSHIQFKKCMETLICCWKFTENLKMATKYFSNILISLFWIPYLLILSDNVLTCIMNVRQLLLSLAKRTILEPMEE